MAHDEQKSEGLDLGGLGVLAVLLALLGLSLGAAYVDLGGVDAAVHLSIAAVMAGIVAWHFMELRADSAMVRLFAGVGFFWILLLFILGFADWWTR